MLVLTYQTINPIKPFIHIIHNHVVREWCVVHCVKVQFYTRRYSCIQKNAATADKHTEHGFAMRSLGFLKDYAPVRIRCNLNKQTRE